MEKTEGYEEKIECQFDTFCKTVLRNCAKNIQNQEKRRKEKTKSLELLTQTELSQLQVCDTYESDYICIKVLDHHIHIEDVALAKGIETLSKRKQEIIIFSFFFGLKSKEIGSLLNLSESTVSEHKRKALKELKGFMEENTDGSQSKKDTIFSNCPCCRRKR